MKLVHTCMFAAAALFTGLSQNAASAACIAGPYMSLPPTTINLSSTILGYVHMQGQSLSVNSTIVSPNGVYQLKFEKEGDLVLYKNGTQRVWSSGIQNCIPTPYAAFNFRLQADGNMVIYYVLQNNPTQPIAVWSTGTFGNNNARFYLRDTGKIEIRTESTDQLLWSN